MKKKIKKYEEAKKFWTFSHFFQTFCYVKTLSYFSETIL